MSAGMEEGSEGLTPEKVLAMLEKHGTIVTIDEAKLILEFMKKLAKMTVNQYLRGS
jgi:ribulose-5-phosphate 4-epimerase/fuculose-1-phosphate aldolase